MIDVGWMELDELEGASLEVLREINLICAKKLNDKKCLNVELYHNIYNKVIELIPKKGGTPLEINKEHYLSKRERLKEFRKLSRELMEDFYGSTSK